MEAIALAAPEETLAVLEKSQIVVDVDPVRVFLVQNGVSSAGGGFGDEEVEAVLNAVQLFDGDGMTVGEPDEAGEEIVARLAKIHPAGFTAGCGDDADA